MDFRKDALIAGGTFASGGFPDNPETGVVQAVTAIVLWLLTKLLDRVGLGKKKD